MRRVCASPCQFCDSPKFSNRKHFVKPYHGRAMIRCILSLHMTIFRGRLRWVLIFWMFAISAIAYLDRVNISIAVDFIEREFKVDDPHFGLVFSAFGIGYALFQAPGGRLADRFG